MKILGTIPGTGAGVGQLGIGLQFHYIMFKGSWCYTEQNHYAHERV